MDLSRYTIAFDFDGTITTESNYPEVASLRTGIKECIDSLYDAGAEIIIWTCRHPHGDKETNLAYQMMVDFLKKHRIKYTDINKNKVPLAPNPGPKVYADLYVDDKILGWNPNITGAELLKQIIHHFKTQTMSVRVQYVDYVDEN